jgi:two-component system response regulator FixJ
MKAGASDFIQKPYDNDTILRTVQSCLAENDVAAVINDARNSAVRRLESLTARERQVLDLIVEGASNKVIAGRLTISPRTVEIYRANVMSKMRAESLSELIRITLSTRAA